MPDTSDTADAGFTLPTRRASKQVEDVFTTSAVQQRAGTAGRQMYKKPQPPLRLRTQMKKAEPFIVEVVAKPKTDLAAAVAAMAERLAQQRERSVQGVLVLPRGTREWRMNKEISAAASEGVFIRVSPLHDLKAGANRILADLLKDTQRYEKHMNAYTAGVQKSLLRTPSAG